MKQITRLDVFKNRVWLTEEGRWTRDQSKAFAFDDGEAERRLKRLPKAEAKSIENKADEEHES